MAPVSDEEWKLSTDYDGHVMCEQCDEIGILLQAPECWSFTINDLLRLVKEHRESHYKHQ